MNETIERINNECNIYLKHNVSMHPSTVKVLVEEAFKAGKKEFTKSYREKYNKEFHDMQHQIWNDEDDCYLVNFYGRITAKEMSYALGRSLDSIYSRITKLKNKGRII